ncbi:hypothetical protein ACNQF7_16005 [Flavobacterium sp. RSP29]|uniref:hypothetical protein n=1 Tax=Flavobacterium sp. RSP29 TaxID=3401731 RepID=UPI003AB007E1
MNILDDTVIPRKHGEIFGTNALTAIDLMEIKTKVLELDRIREVLLNTEIFPRVHCSYFKNSINQRY